MQTLKSIFKNVKIDTKKRKKSVIKELLPNIKAAQEYGFKLEDIYSYLCELGLKTTFKNFKVTYYELKKEKQTAAVKQNLKIQPEKLKEFEEELKKLIYKYFAEK